MSKPEGFTILDTQNAVTIGGKVEKAAQPCPQTVLRRKLADITNLQQKQRPSIQEEKSQFVITTTKEYIDQLQKENMALAKMLAQRNKLIEQSGIELDRLRIHLLKMQEQNQQLALSNTHMLAELNSGKDRLKALQHELGCKNGLLRALELEEKARTSTCKNVDTKLIKIQGEEEPSKEDRNDVKPHNTRRNLRSNSLGSLDQVQTKEKAGNKRRRQSARFKAAELEPAEDSFEIDGAKFPSHHLPVDSESIPEKESTSIQEEGDTEEVRDDDKSHTTKRSLLSSRFGSSDNVQSTEKTENKRPSTRRQSARFKVAELKPAEDSFEIDDDKFPKCPSPDDLPHANGSSSGNSSVKREDNSCSSDISRESQQLGRSSLCRPARQAVKKVQSYREIPVNIKMRRPE